MREIEYRVWDEIEREMYIVEEINFPFKTATVIKRKTKGRLGYIFILVKLSLCNTSAQKIETA